MSLNEFLIWMASSGGNVSIASWIFERIPAFQALQSNAKQMIFFATSFLLALISYLVLTYVPAQVLEQLAPIFSLVYVTFSTLFVGSLFHQIDKLGKKK
jgi:hypothetical protein